MLKITVQDPVDCVPNLTLPEDVKSFLVGSYKYYLGEAPFSIPESPNTTLGNGNCGFTIDFVMRFDASQPDAAIFTKTNVTLHYNHYI